MKIIFPEKLYAKYITRRYTLLEHSLIFDSLLKGHSSLPEIFYTDCVDVSKNGLIGIYALENDIVDNQERVAALACDKAYIEERFATGIQAIDSLKRLPLSLSESIVSMTPAEIEAHLTELKNILFGFGGFFEFTHYLGNAAIKIDAETIEKLGKFHEERKRVFLEYFRFLGEVCAGIAKKYQVSSRSLSFLLWPEILDLVGNTLLPQEAETRQMKRRRRYIILYNPDDMQIDTDDFEENCSHFLSLVKKESERSELSGTGIGKTVVSGTVALVNQKTPLSEIPKSSVIVTPMTHPDMTPLLRHAKAIVTDEGGLLCHAANVAREFGIPCVVGTKIATQVLQDGDLVEVNAFTGVIRKI